MTNRNGKSPKLSAAQLQQLFEMYKEVSHNIRVSDDISFKLLGTVPLAAGIGAGALTLLEKTNLFQTYSGFTVLALSALGLLITTGLFLWEMRNIQKCDWFILQAARLEELLFPDHELKVMQFRGMPSKENENATKLDHIALSSLSYPYRGKTVAEKIIYLAAIATWLVPMAIALHRLLSGAPAATG